MSDEFSRFFFLSDEFSRFLSCRSRQELSNECLLAKFGDHTAEYGPLKVCQKVANYVNPSIPKDKMFDEYHFTKWVLCDEQFQRRNGR